MNLKLELALILKGVEMVDIGIMSELVIVPNHGTPCPHPTAVACSVLRASPGARLAAV